MQMLLFEKTLDDQFDEWIRSQDGQEIEFAVVARALALRAAGWARYGIKAILESIRFDRAVQRGPDAPFKVNNNYASRLARRVMRARPELDGWFETRELLSRRDRRPRRAVVVPIARSS